MMTIARLVDATLERWELDRCAGKRAGRRPRAQVSDHRRRWHAGLDVYLLNVIRAVRPGRASHARNRVGTIINISTAWAFEPSAMF
jgi:hypothetical protein